MAILVIAEHDGKQLKPGTTNTVTAAAKIGGDLTVLVAGSGCAEAAQAAAKIAGVGKVLLADAAQYAGSAAENLAALVQGIAGNYSHILAPATGYGKNFMPRLAALLDVQQISDISAVVSPDTFVRPIYAGNAMATVQSADKVKVITVRATGFDAAGEGGSVPVPTPACRNSTARNCRSPTAPSSLRRASSSPAAAAWAAARTSRSWKRWPTSWAPRSAPRAPRWIPASCPTTTRSARPARSSPRSCTSPSAFPARSSISPA
jgi:electron transfer flavoprotein alpha subunit